LSSKFYQTITTIESDDRGLLLACPQCGQRNRLIYDGSGSRILAAFPLKARENSNWLKFSSFHKALILKMFRIK